MDAGWCVSNDATRLLLLWLNFIWVIAIGRELSWGRVFYRNSLGKVLSIKEIWYGAYVYPTIAAIGFSAILVLIKAGLLKELVFWLKYGKYPNH